MTDVIVIDKLTKSFKGKMVLEDVNMRLQEAGYMASSATTAVERLYF